MFFPLLKLYELLSVEVICEWLSGSAWIVEHRSSQQITSLNHRSIELHKSSNLIIISLQSLASNLREAN